jgi:hypothetical protein
VANVALTALSNVYQNPAISGAIGAASYSAIPLHPWSAAAEPLAHVSALPPPDAFPSEGASEVQPLPPAQRAAGATVAAPGADIAALTTKLASLAAHHYAMAATQEALNAALNAKLDMMMNLFMGKPTTPEANPVAPKAPKEPVTPAPPLENLGAGAGDNMSPISLSLSAATEVRAAGTTAPTTPAAAQVLPHAQAASPSLADATARTSAASEPEFAAPTAASTGLPHTENFAHTLEKLAYMFFQATGYKENASQKGKVDVSDMLTSVSVEDIEFFLQRRAGMGQRHITGRPHALLACIARHIMGDLYSFLRQQVDRNLGLALLEAKQLELCSPELLIAALTKVVMPTVPLLKALETRTVGWELRRGPPAKDMRVHVAVLEREMTRVASKYPQGERDNFNFCDYLFRYKFTDHPTVSDSWRAGWYAILADIPHAMRERVVKDGNPAAFTVSLGTIPQFLPGLLALQTIVFHLQGNPFDADDAERILGAGEPERPVFMYSPAMARLPTPRTRAPAKPRTDSSPPAPAAPPRAPAHAPAHSAANKALDTGRGSSSSKPAASGPPTCNHCGKPGHLERDCRQEGGAAEMLCRFCDSFGHAEDTCRRKKQAQPARAQQAPAPVAPLAPLAPPSGAIVPYAAGRRIGVVQERQ